MPAPLLTNALAAGSTPSGSSDLKYGVADGSTVSRVVK